MSIEHPHALNRPHYHEADLGPATAGNDIASLAGADFEIELIGTYLQFVADANIADRYTRLEVGGASTSYYAAVVLPKMTAGNTYNIWFGRGTGFFSTTFSNGQISIPWPIGLIIKPSEFIRTVTVGIQAGDQFTEFQYKAYRWAIPENI